MDAKYLELEAENARLRAEVAQLKATVERLTAALEAAQRAGKRQAAPFRKSDGPAPVPNKPGRKTGRRHGFHAHRAAPAPREIDETYEAPLPDCCPKCGGRHIEETRIAKQYQTEIPRRPIHREFTIHLGECQDCGQHVRGRHPLQTSHALGAAGSQLGPDAHATFVTLNKGLGLSHGKCRQFFRDVFGILIARATSVRSLSRTARRVEPAYEDLRLAVRRSDWVVPDETGWRVGGRNAWLHAFVSPTATCYEIGDRSAEIALRLLGRDWSGTMIHDGWSVYGAFQRACHQQCLGHLQRRCRELLDTAVRGAARLPQRILALIDEAFALRRAWRGHRLSGDALAEAGLGLACQLEQVVSGRFTHEPNRKLAKHVLGHALNWFWFLIDPTIDATNWRAEQAIRPAVVNRKVWGGNRTWIGAGTQAVLTSLLVTLQQRGYEALTWLSAARCAMVPLPLPP
ncbi:MAG: IS66 family transposase [Verrucomicrobia subdivision 3 bacterium]|nr:IS66 family transposase [Limisphaerales bacterium]